MLLTAIVELVRMAGALKEAQGSFEIIIIIIIIFVFLDFFMYPLC